MKLSVVIPTYNRKDSLRLTLDGLSRQTYPMNSFEVVVVSDGSTDGTCEMLNEYSQSAPYLLRPIQQENRGPSAARNRGICEAQNEIIVFLDDDVEPVPEFLARHASHHDIDEKVVVLGPMSPDPARQIEEPVWIAWEHAKLQQTYALFRPGGACFRQAPCALHFYSGNASVRRCWLEAVNGFDETFKRQEDIELASRMAMECNMRFNWDFDADGLHRPSRTFAAWLNIPKAYGRLDAQRVLSGQTSLSMIENMARRRNPLTRQLTRLCAVQPAASCLFLAFTRTFAPWLHRCRFLNAANALLSALYNVFYHIAFRAELAESNTIGSHARPMVIS